MGWRPKNLNESFFPVNTLFAIVGFHTFQYPLGRPRVFFSVIYTMIFTSVYYVALVYVIKHTMESTWFKLEEIIFTCGIIVNSIIAGMAQILSWYHMKRRSRSMNRIMKVDETLKELGASFDYTNLMYCGIGIIAFWLLIVFITNVVDVLWFPNSVPISERIIMVMIYHLGIHINSIVALNFVLVLRFLDVRFSKVNELLGEILRLVHRRPLNVYSWFSETKVNKEKACAMTKRRILKRPESRKSLVQIIKHVHLELARISQDVNRSYGVQILLEMAAYFVMFTGLLYTLYTMILYPSTDRILIRSIIIITWLVIYSSKLLLINYLCERVTAEANKTGDLIHCVDSTEDFECPDEIRQFSLQLMHNPLSFSPAGFFTLGFRFVQGFLNTVVTYLVILIQMGSVKTKL